MSHVGLQVYFKTQGGEMALGRVIAEYPHYVLLATGFGYNTCVHKTEIANERK